MTASGCISRVGGLTAALGVGFGLAVCAGSGVALADIADSGSAHAATDRTGTPGTHRSAAGRPTRTARPTGAARTPAPRKAAAPADSAVNSRAAGGKAVAVFGRARDRNGISINPTASLVDGIILGSINAESARGLPLSYTPLGGSAGGKMGGGPESYRILPYATWVDTGEKGVETFAVRVREITPVDQFLTGIPLIGLAAEPVINLLQQLPLISGLLIPIIGASTVGRIEVDVADLAPGDTPVAFTYRVTSFDGTPISTNFIPAAGLQAGQTAPTVLNGPGLGGQGETNPYQGSGTGDVVPGVRLIRNAGFNVVTWDPRGEFDSGGIMQLDNPFFEGRDTSAIISWLATYTPAALDGPVDPRVGMVGGSYGGGIQLATAGVDSRIEAIVPAMAWNSLTSSLYPYETFKFAWANILLGILVSAKARVNGQIYAGIFTGDLVGRLSPTSQAMLASSGPTSLLNKLTAPTLLVQGTVDELFPLAEAVANAEAILANPYQTPVKMIWFCGGHGICEDPENPGQRDRIFTDTLAWMQYYVGDGGDLAETIPTFQWYDQRGTYFSSDLLPFQEGFAQSETYSVGAGGGRLGILPVVGGSNGLLTGRAGNALDVVASPPLGSQVVGAPQLSFTYRGVGTSRAVFAQLVDNATGRVVGNIASPVPVTLDGREHRVSVPMSDVAYTVAAGDSLTLQITSSALLFLNSSFGLVDVSDVRLELPLRSL